MRQKLAPPALALGILPLVLAACADQTPWLQPIAARKFPRAGAIGVLVAFGRQAQATIAQVSQLSITLSEQGTSPQTQILASGDFSAHPGVTFGGLPAGTATVALTATDVNGTHLGSASESVPVILGQTSWLSMSLYLNPTYIMASPAPAPTPATALTIYATIWDGPTIVVTPTPSSYPTPVLGATPLPSPTATI